MNWVIEKIAGAGSSRLSRVSIDWLLFGAAFGLSILGLVTMNSFVEGSNSFFEKQLVWIIIASAFMFALSFVDFRFFRRTGVIMAAFLFSCALLLALFAVGRIKGAQSWFTFGGISFQPSDPIKIVVILLLSKYFSRRHIEIANIRHILVSAFYVMVIFILVFLQPDFGSAIIILSAWLGMVLVSGISKKHLFAVFAIGAVSFGFLWLYVFQDYQKQRILTFINPLADIRGAGYNAYQSMIAVGSGQVFGKGIGYGTQSKLQFLPEYQTDFIFAAFAEEWGFVGVTVAFALYGIVIWRILANAKKGETNFEMLFGAGLAVIFISHFVIHVGMNLGLLPVTGTTIPFMSYGGSHLLMEYGGLGILMGMRRYQRAAHRDAMRNEVLGVVE